MSCFKCKSREPGHLLGGTKCLGGQLNILRKMTQTTEVRNSSEYLIRVIKERRRKYSDEHPDAKGSA